MSPSSPTTPLKKDKQSSPPSLVTNTSRIPSTGFSTATSLTSSFEPLSSAEILERVPTAVVRLLAALHPFIHGCHRFVRLATWTGGKGSGSSSMLLLVSFWLVCAFGYEFIRYAPQLLVLGFIAYTGIRRQLAFAKPRSYSTKIYDRQDVISAATINTALAELSELADFFSSLRKNVFVPTVQLLSWEPSPSSTKAVAAFVIFTWPLWLAAFLPLRESGFPSLVLPISGVGILSSVSSAFHFAYDHTLRLIGPDHLATLQAKAAPLFARIDQAGDLLARTPLPVIWSSVAAVLGRIRWEQWTDFKVTLLPPYPIGALTVRSLVCLVGTIALTWCSPWCSLFRQAIWKSATIRRLVRGTGRVLSGQRPFREAYGKGNLDDEWAHGLYHEDGTDILANASTRSKAQSKKGEVSTKDQASDEEKVIRHEDVVYQFSIFENQRWWVGLDWTAALLPQERPSWSDESNNPVSPPSSFSLPPTKIMLTPSPTPTDPKAFTRRTIKWQWMDPEWTIAGVSSTSGGHYPSSAVYKGSAKEAAIKSANAAGDKEPLASAKQGYIGDALNRIRARASGGGAAESDAGSMPSSPSLGDVGATATLVGSGGSKEGEEEWDVDADGWQYGDNAWEKMSKKNGMGRYTRRRKWIRRAVLLEIVEHGIHGPAPAPASASASPSSASTNGGKDTASSPSSTPAAAAATGGVEKGDSDTKIESDDTEDLKAVPPINTDIDMPTTTKTESGSISPSGSFVSQKRPSISDRLANATK